MQVKHGGFTGKLTRWYYGIVQPVLIVMLSLLATGCTTVGYYSQSVRGHLSIWMKRRDMQVLIDQPATSDKLKTRLQLILQIREFASKDLALPDNYSFKSYANINRSNVVWNVVATPEFSLQPKKWCFPVLGCLSYKGYYKKARTLQEAKRLRALGYDVYVGGATAYSTLGWFADPVLNTYVFWDEASLAGLLFHELAHQLIYIKGDTAFNESFATAVELEGIRRWVNKTGHVGLFKKYQLQKKREDEFIQFVLGYRTRLEQLYREKIPAAVMRSRKAAVIATMKRDYQRLKKTWQGYKGYDQFMSKPINNAQIASVATYYKYVSGFERLLRNNGNDLAKFYAAVKRIGKLPEAQRKKLLLSQ